MNLLEVKRMRRKQIIVLNSIVLTAFLIYFIIIHLFEVTFTSFFTVFGVLVMIQAITLIIKSKSTKSIFPIIEKVYIYEKEKMGNEWVKQRRIGAYINLLLGCILFLNAYSSAGVEDNYMKINPFLLVAAVIFLCLLNVTLHLHNRKIDNSTQRNLKGYSWKFLLISLFAGLGLGAVIIIGTFYFIITTV
ncbi:hypothetical protein [Fredinandcohnia sp. 179-A 10B2 NHS]|uniref:hypothetical protein n=1 Tax=Fredinandcohnia sp. 179-A 10B2 NHS TaxID=3235176 RepID=UPI00399FB638